MTVSARSFQPRVAPRILVAGFGNVLRHDDAFGVFVAQRLRLECLPSGVVIHEAGIAGLTLVQELFDGYDGLMVLDAVDRGAEPGTLFELEPTIPDVRALDSDQHFDFFADMHYAEPGRAMALAQALGALPRSVVVVGCQIGQDEEEYGLGFTPAVEAALERAVVYAVEIINRMTTDLEGLSEHRSVGTAQEANRS